METVLDLPTPRVLRTEDEFQAAVAEIDRLLAAGSESDNAGEDRLELLSVLVEDYEKRHYPIDASDLTLQDLLDFMADQRMTGDRSTGQATSTGE
jgi:HTH-type transcriptional regulator/antitoxin HigA